MNRPSNAGFTLIEVLVAMAVFSVSVLLIGLLISHMRLNAASAQRVTAGQALQDALERTAQKFQSVANYGVLTAADAPAALAGHTWTVSLCTASPTADTCTGTATFTQGGAYAYSNPTADLIRMTVQYTPTAMGTATTRAALEIARP